MYVHVHVLYYCALFGIFEMTLRARWIKLALELVLGCLVLLCFWSLLHGRNVQSRFWEEDGETLSAAKSQLMTVGLGAGCATTSTEVRKPPGGFMLAFRFWEQQTQAMKSLLQLQCLATHFGMQTVEPFLYKSFLGFPWPNLTNHLLHLGDLVDINVWNEGATKQFNLFPLAPWSEFLHSAPRKVIIVCVRYHNRPRITLPDPGFDYRMGCPEACYLKLNASLSVLNRYGRFKVVRVACANFVDYGGAVSEHSLIDNILGKYDHRKVTVLMNEFRGFFGLFRMPVLSNCGIELYKPNFTVLPSVAIMDDAARYIAEVFNGEPFVAVLVRIERVVLHMEHDITECSNTLKSLLVSLSKEHGTNHYFLAMDVGKFGSSGSITHNLTLYGNVVLKAVFGGSVTFNEWESLFETHTSKLEAAYVANLQRAIAAQSHCLVMFGGGGFQGQARDFYEQQHPYPRGRCIHKLCHEHKGLVKPTHVQIL